MLTGGQSIMLFSTRQADLALSSLLLFRHNDMNSVILERHLTHSCAWPGCRFQEISQNQFPKKWLGGA